MWDIVWVSLQGHRSVSISRHFLLQAPQCPCSVRKRFSRDQYCLGRPKPSCWIVGLHTRWELTTWADFQLCLHRLLIIQLCLHRLLIIIIIIIGRFVSAPITVKNIGAWQCMCGKKSYAKLRENKIVLSSHLKKERDDSCLVCSGSWFHAAETECENAHSPNFVRSRGLT